MKKEKSCGCIIIENEKVLLIKDTNGNWGFPKGQLEKLKKKLIYLLKSLVIKDTLINI